MWLEFSFQTGGDIRQVYSSEEAQRLIEAGELTPDTRLTVFTRSGPQLMLAGSLDQLQFGGAESPDPVPLPVVPSADADTAHPVTAVSQEDDEKGSGAVAPPAAAQQPKAATTSTASAPLGRAQAEMPRHAEPGPNRKDTSNTIGLWVLGIGGALLALLLIYFVASGPEQRWLVQEASVYAQPTDGPSLATLSMGTPLEVEEVEDYPGWFRIVSGDYQDKYVRETDLTDVEPLADQMGGAAGDAAADAATPAADAAMDVVEAEQPAPDVLPPPTITRPLAPPRDRNADLPPRCRSFTVWVDQQLCRSADLAENNRRLEAAHAEAVRILGSSAAGPSPSMTRGRLASCNPDPQCLSNGIAARTRDLDIMVGNAKSAQAAAAAAAAVDRSRPLSVRGNEQRWVTGDDYPASAVRERAQGAVTAQLSVGRDGRVERCDIVASSGNSALDSTTCRILQRRARFDPALDRTGTPIPASFTKRVVWQLPDD